MGADDKDRARAQVRQALRTGDFGLAGHLIERGDATWQELGESLRTYQAELEAQSSELRAANIRIEGMLQRFRSLFSMLPLPVVVCDEMGFITDANHHAVNAFGLRAGHLLNHPVWRLARAESARLRLQVTIAQAVECGHAVIEGLELSSSLDTVLHADLHFECMPPVGSDAPQLAVAIVDQSIHVEAAEQLRRLNEQLRREQAQIRRLSLVASHTHNFVILTDAQRRITWVNEAFARVTGFSLEEVIGRSPGSLLQGPGTDPATVRSMHERLARRQSLQHVEVLNYTRDRRPYWVLLEVQPVFDALGHVEQYIGVQTDITARKQAEAALRESEQYRKAIFDAEPGIVMALRADRSISLMNRAGAALLGLQDADDALGQTFDRFVSPDELVAVHEAHRTALVGATVTVQFALANPADGGPRWMEARLVPLWHNGTVDAVVVVAYDITGQREAQALRVQKEAAETASRAKSEFLSRMSHELRTPLNAVLGFAQLLRADPRLEAVHREKVRHIETAGWHLLELINDVLDVSRIESGRMELELVPISLSDLFESCAAMVASMASQMGVQIDLSGARMDLWAVADKLRMKQVMTNLLTNAVKFNHSGGRVAIMTRADDTSVTIAVVDTGIGLSPGQLTHLFEPFNRLGAERRGVDGTGIGLVITRRLVELMGGTIAVDSQPEQGSTFSVSLPRAFGGAAPTEFASSDRGAVDIGGRVLYIEDVESNVELVRAALQGSQWQLDVALDGQTGLQRARETVPDLILLDLQLPDLPGDEVRKRLVADPLTAAIPVVALTADVVGSRHAQQPGSGYRACVLKPIGVTALRSAMARAVTA